MYKYTEQIEGKKAWREVFLGDLANFQTGKLDSNAATTNGSYPFFTCSPETLRIDTYSFETECVLLAGNNANGVFPIKYFNGRFDAYQRTYVIESQDATSLTNMFLFYMLQPQIAMLKNIATGATTKFLTMGILKGIKLDLPPLPIQKKIASILSAYDDLIENNNRRIKILEEMAQNIYREWFVHFRYPGHEDVPLVDSELGQIPQGWEVKKVEDLVNRERPGKLFSQKTVFEQGDVPVLDQGKSGIIGYHDEAPGVLASLDEPIIIFANHTCYQRIIMFPFSAIQNVLPFRPHPQILRNIYWLHWATKDLVTFNDYKGHWPEFMAKSLPVPPTNLSEQFGSIAEQIVRMSFRLGNINQNLRKTRDMLLPKLISGQLDVEELDIKV